jgi:hypothetical protein
VRRIYQWQGTVSGWRRDIGRAELRVCDEPNGRCAWALAFRDVKAHGLRTYKTAAGARAACERVARRLGVV